MVHVANLFGNYEAGPEPSFPDVAPIFHFQLSSLSEIVHNFDIANILYGNKTPYLLGALPANFS